MKNTLSFFGYALLASLSLTVSSCLFVEVNVNPGFETTSPEPSPSTRPVDVFVVGSTFEGSSVNIAKVWTKGKAFSLTDGTRTATANSIFISGSDIYVAGFENKPMSGEPANGVYVTVAKYWKNGLSIELTNETTGSAVAHSIFVVGSDVYVAGEIIQGQNSIATYWKNGNAVHLSDGSVPATATSIFVSGRDVYVAGQEGSPHIAAVAKYWKNGNGIPLTDGTGPAGANSILVSGKDIYVVGFEGALANTAAKYWKNNAPIILTNGQQHAEGKSIFVSGSDVYVSGFDGLQAKYWKNNIATVLTDGTKGSGSGNSIFVSGTDVYVAGNASVDEAKYWKNGVPVKLTNAHADAAFAEAIFIAPATE
jgi:hypothetical protein